MLPGRERSPAAAKLPAASMRMEAGIGRARQDRQVETASSQSP